MDQGRRAKVSCNPNTSNPYNKSHHETHAVTMVCGAGMFHAQRRATQPHHKYTHTHAPYTLHTHQIPPKRAGLELGSLAAGSCCGMWVSLYPCSLAMSMATMSGRCAARSCCS